MTESNAAVPSNKAPKHNEPLTLLTAIEAPQDVRKLTPAQLPQLCSELRQYMIANLCNNPGHFASSMGAVEIVVALHYVFNTPRDRLVWDVGHQAYAHKLLTGRREAFASQRTLGGISGFPTPLESPFDTFMAGHASNSISAALGMAIADMQSPEDADRKTVAVIGDASISGGLAFEGLNNASNHPNNLLIILNDNDMSIDANVGALHHYLSDLTTSKSYNRWRHKAYNFLRRKGFINDGKKGRIIRFNNSLKSFISAQKNIFEGLDIRYFGPFDGHDVEKLVKVLSDIKDMTGPRILHLRTIKGKGFPVAEKNPAAWHAPGKFNPDTGEKIRKKSSNQPLLWQEVFGHTLIELAETDQRIVGITAAMPSGTSVGMMMERFPDRAFDVGISEGHAVTFAGGMAAAGKRPFVAIYSSFLQRAYDSIIHDVAIQGLPITFCIDRAGLVGEDGVTHHGLFDLCYLRCIPGLKVASPLDEATLRSLMFTSLSLNGPMAIRYPRGTATTPHWHTPMQLLKPGEGRRLTAYDGARIAVLSVGPIGHEVDRAISKVAEKGIYADHYDMIWIKPLDEKILADVVTRYDAILTVEDGVVNGGFGSAVADWLTANGHSVTLEKAGIPDRWIMHASVPQLWQQCGLDADSLAERIETLSKAHLPETAPASHKNY